MLTRTKRKVLSGALRGSSAVVAAAIPIWLIAQKFPLWATEQSTTVSLTGGGIAVMIVASLAFRKRLWRAIKPALAKLKNRGGLVLGTVIVSGVILGICGVVETVYPILPDIETICMGGVVSGLAGVGLDAAAMVAAPKEENGEGKKEEV